MPFDFLLLTIFIIVVILIFVFRSAALCGRLESDLDHPVLIQRRQFAAVLVEIGAAGVGAAGRIAAMVSVAAIIFN